jgi:hypothetical protein
MLPLFSVQYAGCVLHRVIEYVHSICRESAFAVYMYNVCSKCISLLQGVDCICISRFNHAMLLEKIEKFIGVSLLLCLNDFFRAA